MAHHRKFKKYSKIIQIVIVIVTIFLVYTLFQYYERDPPPLVILARGLGILFLCGLVAFYLITRSPKINSALKGALRYFNAKLLRVRINIQIKKGNSLIQKQESLSAYNIFHSLLETSQEVKNHEELFKKVRQREQTALSQLEKDLEVIVNEFKEKIRLFQESYSCQLIIDIYDDFLDIVQDYPKTEVIKDLCDSLQIQHDESLTNIWEPQCNKVKLEIERLLKKNSKDTAIKHGREFLADIKICPSIRDINTFRDDIYILIVNPITQFWQERYDEIVHTTRRLASKKQYLDAISKWKLFLKESEIDKNVLRVQQLRTKASRKLNEIEDRQPRIEAEDTYNTIVSKAITHYKNKEYPDASVLMDEAIALLIKSNRESGWILLKDTKIILRDFEFREFCKDKVIEVDIIAMIKKADVLFKKGKELKSRNILQKAQELHDEFSNIYEKHERSKHKNLIREIRAKINRVSEKAMRRSILMNPNIKK